MPQTTTFFLLLLAGEFLVVHLKCHCAVHLSFLAGFSLPCCGLRSCLILGSSFFFIDMSVSFEVLLEDSRLAFLELPSATPCTIPNPEKALEYLSSE